MKLGKSYFLKMGFLPCEATAFQDITEEALDNSPYIKKMIRGRVLRYLRAGRDGLTSREYFFRIRKHYVDLGLFDTKHILIGNNKKSQSQSFKLFNYYKDEYGARDKDGKLVGTPRPKTKVVKKGGSAKDRLIRSTKNEIERLRGRLKFEKNEDMQKEYQNRIKTQQNRLNQLRGK